MRAAAGGAQSSSSARAAAPAAAKARVDILSSLEKEDGRSIDISVCLSSTVPELTLVDALGSVFFKKEAAARPLTSSRFVLVREYHQFVDEHQRPAAPLCSRPAPHARQRARMHRLPAARRLARAAAAAGGALAALSLARASWADGAPASPPPPQRRAAAAAGAASSPPPPPALAAAPPAEADAAAPLVNPPKPGKKRLLVIGTGWAAASFLQKLAPRDNVEVTVVSPRSYFIYSPLLPAAAVGSVEPRSIVEPIRNLLPAGAEYVEAAAEAFDLKARTVLCRSTLARDAPFRVGFDACVFAPGSTSNTFGTQGVAEHCLFLKSAEDAARIRTAVHDAFERASLPLTPEAERRRLLSFVVCGGGPTGAEVAAEIADTIKVDMERQHPALRGVAKVHVIDSNSHVLSMFDRQIAEYATGKFRRDGIDLILNARVTGVDAEAVTLVHKKTQAVERLPSGATIWATGVGLHPLAQALARSLPKGAQRNSRALTVDDRMRVLGCSEAHVFCIGDAATIDQRKALAHASALFAEFDADKSGALDVQELAALLNKAKARFPQFGEYVRLFSEGKVASAAAAAAAPAAAAAAAAAGAPAPAAAGGGGGGGFSFLGLFGGGASAASSAASSVISTIGHGLSGSVGGDAGAGDVSEALRAVFRAADTDGNGRLDEAEFRALLEGMDKHLRSVPATAQVAKQQGHYLAAVANESPEAFFGGAEAQRPFVWTDMGSLAFLGGDEAAARLPGFGVVQGVAAGALWRGYETSNQQSWRSRSAVAFDQIKVRLFGRDTSTLRR